MKKIKYGSKQSLVYKLVNGDEITEMNMTNLKEEISEMVINNPQVTFKWIDNRTIEVS